MVKCTMKSVYCQLLTVDHHYIMYSYRHRNNCLAFYVVAVRNKRNDVQDMNCICYDLGWITRICYS